MSQPVKYKVVRAYASHTFAKGEVVEKTNGLVPVKGFDWYRGRDKDTGTFIEQLLSSEDVVPVSEKEKSMTKKTKTVAGKQNLWLVEVTRKDGRKASYGRDTRHEARLTKNRAIAAGGKAQIVKFERSVVVR